MYKNLEIDGINTIIYNISNDMVVESTPRWLYSNNICSEYYQESAFNPGDPKFLWAIYQDGNLQLISAKGYSISTAMISVFGYTELPSLSVGSISIRNLELSGFDVDTASIGTLSCTSGTVLDIFNAAVLSSTRISVEYAEIESLVSQDTVTPNLSAIRQIVDNISAQWLSAYGAYIHNFSGLCAYVTTLSAESMSSISGTFGELSTSNISADNILVNNIRGIDFRN